MQRYIVPSLAAAAVIAVSVAVASGSDKPASASKTTRAQSTTVSVEQVDNAPPGVSAGDLLVFRNRLTRAGKALGSLEIACTFVKLEEDYACHGTAFLPGGRLALSGALSLDRQTNVLPIIGGTGRYRRARGTLTARQTGEETSVLRFDIATR